MLFWLHIIYDGTPSFIYRRQVCILFLPEGAYANDC